MRSCTRREQPLAWRKIPGTERMRRSPPRGREAAGTIAQNARMKSAVTFARSPEPAQAVSCAPGLRFKDRMKKNSLLFLLLPVLATACFAQESRQDISVSGTVVLPPYVNGQAVFQSGCNAPSFQPAVAGGTGLSGTCFGPGVLASYRYMVTPRSGLEANYQWSQYFTNYSTSQLPTINVHTRLQEFSVAYVYNFTFKRFNPFAEAGVGAFLFSPLDDTGTQRLGVKRTTAIGALYGGGIAYELSPSFDIRAEYRGIIVKAPDFGFGSFDTKRYYNISAPAIGIAYHF
jgi:outer membrane immunogenic protein